MNFKTGNSQPEIYMYLSPLRNHSYHDNQVVPTLGFSRGLRSKASLNLCNFQPDPMSILHLDTRLSELRSATSAFKQDLLGLKFAVLIPDSTVHQ